MAAKHHKHGLGFFIVRLYAFAVLLLTVWAGYTAFAYLFRSVFTPTQVPKQFTSWTRSLEVKPDGKDQIGTIEKTSRAPLNHFHRLDRPLTIDPHNGCLTSGCHAPLPHSKSKALRAFANFHTTFLSCGMCHYEPNSLPMPASWVSIADEDVVPPPATLQLETMMETKREAFRNDPQSVQRELITLLKKARRVAHADAELKHTLVRIETSEPGSPVWLRAVESLRMDLPNTARGDYGAKLAPYTTTDAVHRAAKALRESIKDYFAAPPNSKQREAAYDQIHAPVIAKPKGCLACHASEPPRLDFEALGYSATRAAALHDATIAAQMQHIQEGESFHLPSVLEGVGG